MTPSIRHRRPARKMETAKARALLASLLLVTLSTGLSGCASESQRGVKWCEDNFFGTTLAQCRNHMHHEYGR